MDRNRLAQLFLASGLIVVFGWFGIDKFRDPIVWIGFLPAWMDSFLGMTKNTWLQLVAVIEVALALALCIPVRRIQQAAAALMSIHLAAVLWQVGWNDIGVRDSGLLMSSLALLFLL